MAPPTVMRLAVRCMVRAWSKRLVTITCTGCQAGRNLTFDSHASFVSSPASNKNGLGETVCPQDFAR